MADDANGDSLDLIVLDLPNDLKLPTTVRELTESRSFLRTEGTEGENEEYMLSQGRCPVCGSRLGPDTSIIVMGDVIVSLVCRGVCLDDLFVMAFLMEQAKDLSDRTQMRSEVPK